MADEPYSPWADPSSPVYRPVADPSHQSYSTTTDPMHVDYVPVFLAPPAVFVPGKGPVRSVAFDFDGQSLHPQRPNTVEASGGVVLIGDPADVREVLSLIPQGQGRLAGLLDAVVGSRHNARVRPGAIGDIQRARTGAPEEISDLPDMPRVRV